MRRILLACSLLLIPSALSAHGTMQKIVEGKYVLNLSSAPLAPDAGKRQQNVLSLSDVETNTLIPKASIFTVEIRKDETVIHRFENLVATGGLLQLDVTYPDPGLYELAATFRVPGDPATYEPEDYWVQVHAPVVTPTPAVAIPVGFSPIWFGLGIAIGISVGLRKGKALGERGKVVI